MKALTFWQPYASLVILGLKPHEFRTWPAPRSIVDQRIVIHAAKRPIHPTDMLDLLNLEERLEGSVSTDENKKNAALDLLGKVWRGETELPLAAGLGTAVLGQPLKAIDLFAGRFDPSDLNPDMWAWPLTDIEPFARPIPCRGAQGFWNWPSAEQMAGAA